MHITYSELCNKKVLVGDNSISVPFISFDLWIVSPSAVLLLSARFHKAAGIDHNRSPYIAQARPCFLFSYRKVQYVIERYQESYHAEESQEFPRKNDPRSMK